MLGVIGKMIGIAVVMTINFVFWAYVEQTLRQESWHIISRFLYMSANAYILYRTIIIDNNEN
jgi:hypothetical protein